MYSSGDASEDGFAISSEDAITVSLPNRACTSNNCSGTGNVPLMQDPVNKTKTFSSNGNQNNCNGFQSQEKSTLDDVTNRRGRLHCILHGFTGAVCVVANGASGALEALVIDVKEVAWWLVRLSISHQTYTRFQDQVSSNWIC